MDDIQGHHLKLNDIDKTITGIQESIMAQGEEM